MYMAVPVIGVDLGTLSLRAAVFRDKQIQLIKDELGNESTPSYVGFNRQQSDSADILLGQHALDLAQRDLALPVYGLKKLLGRKADDPLIKAERSQWPFEIEAGENGDALIRTNVKSRPLYTPEELLSMLVRKVVGHADIHVGVPVKEAVVTVPACFTFMDRDKVARLCESAGIKATRMLNESWAAAIAHGYETDLSGLVNAIVVNVEDGFVDICCMTIDDTIYEVHSSYGSPITPDMMDEFKSGNFEKVVKFVKHVRSVSKESKFDHVFLSGGSSILPLLHKTFNDVFVSLSTVVVTNPSTAVVRGAAIYGGLLAGVTNKRLRDLLILSATNFALGVKTADGSTKVVVNQNSTLALKQQRQFTTSVDHQTTVVFEVYETGEQGGAGKERLLGEVVLSDLPPLSKGRLVLDVTIDINFENVITVTVKYAKLGLKKKLTLSKVNVSNIIDAVLYIQYTYNLYDMVYVTVIFSIFAEYC